MGRTLTYPFGSVSLAPPPVPIDRTAVITNLQDRIVATPTKAPLRVVVVPILAFGEITRALLALTHR